ncbi:hypothetical protein [Inquilinus sp. Marseille-Q2685]|uniref:hypothetical protein n=1 Tax=Inquilinus sp. Marseille-Q2685 TaxID=2866581 RepID=UPI001CE4486E|nr:hypothetical protein [Inquilinus sp. Marseille-Q2685]
MKLRPLRVLEFLLITVPGLIGLVLALRAAIPLMELVQAELARTPEAQEVEAALTAWTRAGTSPEQIDAGLATAFAEDDIDGAAVWLKVAGMTGYPVRPEWRERYEDETSTTSSAARAARQAVAGAVTGEGHGLSGLAGAFAADMTFVGDLRDIGRELWHFGGGDPVDELALGLSGIGLTLTAATWGSGGAAALPRGAVSVFKIARRTGRLSARFAERLGRMVADVVDFPALRRQVREAGWQDTVMRPGAVFAAAIRRDRLDGLDEAVGAAGRVADRVGPAQSVELLRYVDDVPDLRRIDAVSAVMGDRTLAVFKVLKRGALTTVKATIRWSRRLADLTATVLFGAIGFVFALVYWLRLLLLGLITGVWWACRAACLAAR